MALTGSVKAGAASIMKAHNEGLSCELCFPLLSGSLLATVSASPSAEPKASHRKKPELVIFSWAVAAVFPKAACWVVREEPFPAKRARTRVISKITVVARVGSFSAAFRHTRKISQ